jgi:hypothetical protein
VEGSAQICYNMPEESRHDQIWYQKRQNGKQDISWCPGIHRGKVFFVGLLTYGLMCVEFSH